MDNMRLESIVSLSAKAMKHDKNVFDALNTMRQYGISSIVIVDVNNFPIGIFTERDALKAVSQDQWKETPLENVMSHGVLSASASQYLHDGYAMMEQHGYRHLVVVDEEGKYIGVVSEGDFLRHMGFDHLATLTRVEDAMSEAPLSVDTNVSLSEVMGLMRIQKKEYVVVIEAGKPIRVITEREVIAHCMIHGEDHFAIVGDLDPITPKLVNRNVPLQEAAVMMKQHGVHQLIVVDSDNMMVGILDRHDILKALQGAYFEFLIRVIDQKSDALEQVKIKESELRSQKEESQKSELKFRKLFEALPDGCILMDDATVSIEYNEAVCTMLGYEYDEFKSLKVSDYEVLESPEETARRVQNIVTYGRDRFETQHHRKDGSVLDVAVNVVALELEQKPHMIALYHDITEQKKIVEALRQKHDELNEKHSFLSTLIKTIPDLIWIKDLDGRYLACNPMFERLYNAKESDILGKTDFDFVDPELAQFFRDNDLKAFEQDGTRHNEEYLVFGDGSYSGYFDTIKTPLKNSDGKVIGVLGVARDISRIKEKEREIDQVQALAKIGSWRIDAQSGVLEWSDETYRIFGVSKETPISYDLFLSIVHPYDVQRVNQVWQDAIKGERYQVEHRIVVNGEVRWVSEYASIKIDAKGNFQVGLGSVQDITELKKNQSRLEELANYDTLTGLANRALLLKHLKHLIERSRDQQTQIALLMFDLDRFKDVNDSFGHSVGDELLVVVAQRFSERLRDGDFIARLGGDEFAIVMRNLNRSEDAAILAEELIERLRVPYDLDNGINVHIGVSAGIALYPDHGRDSDALLQYADAALYTAKSEGRGVYRYYTDALTEAARHRIELVAHLKNALLNNEFELYYQPQVHIATGKIVGAEALIRWHHPIRGMVPPDEFIPIAEESGLISPIGEWVIQEACRQGKKWLNQGHKLTIAVNVSPHQIRHQNVPKIVHDALVESGFNAYLLEIELTESALMQREEETLVMLHTLRAYGIRLAIDDFGTGYSSFSYLKRFPIDVLKIDKSFIDDIPIEPDDMAITSAIITMGLALGFQVLAEGTESIEQIEFLKERGCSLYQGYYKSKPVPAAEFEKLLG